MLKDPFIFDFLTLEEPFHERELETGLLHHIEKFLLELGRGFAFVGRQYRLDDKVAGTFKVPSAESLATAELSGGASHGTRSVPATLEAMQDYRGHRYV